MDADKNEPATPWEFKPGDTISPAEQVGPSLPASAPSNDSAAPGDNEPQPKVVASEAAAPAETTQPQAQAPAAPVPQPAGSPDSQDSITWTASEFIAHQKTAAWYLVLAGAALALAAITWLLTKDVISAAVICIGALFLGVYAARQPRQLPYVVDTYGVSIGSRHIPYEHFRSFALVHEGAMPSIVLLPLKRFAPLITIYFDPADEQRIAEFLSNFLPVEDHRLDPMDRFLSRIRF